MQKLMSDENFHRTIGKLEATLELLETRLRDLDQTMKTISTTTAKLEPKLDAMDSRLKKLEDANSFVVGKIIGSILLAVLGLVVLKTGIPLPK